VTAGSAAATGDIDGVSTRPTGELLLTRNGTVELETIGACGEDAVYFTSSMRGRRMGGAYKPLLTLDGRSAGLTAKAVVGIEVSPS
jgi:hypothetical protein